MSGDLRKAYATAEEADRKGTPYDWKATVSTVLQELNLPDYSEFIASRGLPKEWIRRDSTVDAMQLDGILALADAIAKPAPVAQARRDSAESAGPEEPDAEEEDEEYEEDEASEVSEEANE